MRENKLIQVLQQNKNTKEIHDFLSFNPSEKDLSLLKETGREVLARTPFNSFDCASMTALWTAFLEDHSKIPVVAIAGTLKYRNITLFKCNGSIPAQKTKTGKKEFWDGHCWIEFAGMIGDVSILRTISSEIIPPDIKSFFNKTFGTGTALICATPTHFESLGLVYEPHYCLSTEQINGLISGSYNSPS